MCILPILCHVLRSSIVCTDFITNVQSLRALSLARFPRHLSKRILCSRDAKELKYLRYKMCTQNALYEFISPFPFLFKFVLILILTNDINMIRCNLILPPVIEIINIIIHDVCSSCLFKIHPMKFLSIDSSTNDINPSFFSSNRRFFKFKGKGNKKERKKISPIYGRKCTRR